MLLSNKKLLKMSVAGIDGKLGKLADIYFDDEQWVVRHLQVETGGWLTGRSVLLSPIAVDQIDLGERVLRMNLTREQIRNSPPIDAHKPVSRQHEADLYQYYGYPYYWSGPYMWGYAPLPAMADKAPREDPARHEAREQIEQSQDGHLRSCQEVTGYHIHARDATLGHLEEFLVDDEDWSINLLVIDTRNWWPGKHVLIPPRRVERVSWDQREVFVDATRTELENSPEYDSGELTIASGRELFRASRSPLDEP